ncbi:MAG: OmpA family protein [Alphaproteobacteria bacterium]|nr:OmpA family protein [Alphaproteobacteria bacterium]
MALPLAGCSHVPDAVNPVAWYRGVSGNSQNDVEDTNQRNQQNLEAGSNEPYPNLATVPNVPSGATSTAERQKLVDSLVADRRHAQYSNEQLQAGSQVASVAPPPPAAPKLPPPGMHATEATTAPRAVPPTPVTTSTAPPAPAQESSLTSPTIRSVPRGEAPPPPPTPARVMTTQPPPAPKVTLTPPPPPSAAPTGVRGSHPSLAMRTPATAANPITVSVGDIVFPPGSADLAATQESALNEIAGLYKQTGGEIRVVGHAEPGHSTDAMRQRIAGLDLALDRANAVAQALSKLGVPPRNIRVEAAPAVASARSRAEVFMEY